jgi:hypothetical protein
MPKYSWSDNNSYNLDARKNQLYETLDFSSIRRVYFNGGEPLMGHDHIKLLTRIQQQGQLNECEISYNTNGTQALLPVFVDLWRKAKLVRIYLSVDAAGSAFEYVRWPGKWQQLETFVKQIFSLDFNVILDVTTTVGIHNIFELPALICWYRKTCATNPAGDPGLLNLQSVGSLSHGGRVLNLSNMGPDLTAMAEQTLKPFCADFSMIDYFVHLMRSSKKINWAWRDYLQELDCVRNTNWQLSLPSLAQAASKL